MLFFISDKTDVTYNLALEEILANNLEEEIFFFWRNTPTIVVGRNQNTYAEINSEFVSQKAINVVRRMTGGGAVYQDLGNINYTYITNFSPDIPVDFKWFAQPIMEVLNSFEIPVEFSGRNDILINNQKISGTAQSRIKNRILFHGTLLFNSDLEVLSQALKVNKAKIISKGIKSVRSRVTTISEHLPQKMEVETFLNKMSDKIRQKFQIVEDYKIPDDLDEKTNQLADEKYRQWSWNYGDCPEFNFSKTEKFAVGEVTLSMNIQKGVIKNIKFYGDFFGNKNVKDLELALVNTTFEPKSICKILDNFNIADSFMLISQKEILSLFE